MIYREAIAFWRARLMPREARRSWSPVASSPSRSSRALASSPSTAALAPRLIFMASSGEERVCSTEWIWASRSDW
jgi:hypothetical protein